MWFVVVVFSELFYVVEFWVVGCECLEEPFYLSLCGWFSSGTHDMLYSMFDAEVCESAVSVVAPVLGSMVR